MCRTENRKVTGREAETGTKRETRTKTIAKISTEAKGKTGRGTRSEIRQRTTDSRSETKTELWTATRKGLVKISSQLLEAYGFWGGIV